MVGRHAYTVLGVAVYKGEKLVKIRNPWGVEEYTGAWSEKSSKWTQDARKVLNHPDLNDGIFFVPMSLYKTVFEFTNTSFYADWKV